MPTYEYECFDCKRTFEAFQNITANPLKKCRFCGGRVRRLIGGGAGIIFKGSGFYATDYRKNDYKKKEKQELEKSKPPAPEYKSCPHKKSAKCE